MLVIFLLYSLLVLSNGAAMRTPSTTGDSVVPLYNEAFNVSFSFSTTTTGYVPFFDLVVGPGLTVGYASLKYVTPVVYKLPIAGGSCVTHPLVSTAEVCSPFTDTGLNFTLVTVAFPYTVLSSVQPSETVTFQMGTGTNASILTPIPAYFRGGFALGLDYNDTIPLLNNDDPSYNSWDNITVTFQLWKVKFGVPGTVVSGPSWATTLSVAIDVASTFSLNNVTVNITCSEEQSVTGVQTPNGASIYATPVRDGKAHAAFKNSLNFMVSQVNGTSSTADLASFLNFFVPRYNAGNKVIISDTSSCVSSSRVVYSVSAVWNGTQLSSTEYATFLICYTWTSTIGRVNNDAGYPGLTVGDVVEWSVSTKVSDYYTFTNFTAEITLSDGHFEPTKSPVVTSNSESGTVPLVVTNGTNPGESIVTIFRNFNVSGPTTVSASLVTLTKEEYTSSYIFPGQTIFSNASVYAADSLQNTPTVVTRSMTFIEAGSKLEIFQVNGVTCYPCVLTDLVGGSNLTYRFTDGLASSNILNYTLSVFFPTPLVDPRGVTYSSFPPTPGFYPNVASMRRGDALPYFSRDPLSVVSSNLGITMNYGTIKLSPAVYSQIDMLYTVVVQDYPQFGEGTKWATLMRVNQGSIVKTNSLMFGVKRPTLSIASSIFSCSPGNCDFRNSENPYSCDLPFCSSAGLTSAPYCGLVSGFSGGLFAIDFDAQDTLTFGVLIKNTGTSSAFDIQVSAIFSPHMLGTSFCVVGSNGIPIPYTGDFFSGDGTISFPPNFSLRAGDEIFFMGYVVVSNSVKILDEVNSTFAVTSYATFHGGKNHVPIRHVVKGVNQLSVTDVNLMSSVMASVTVTPNVTTTNVATPSPYLSSNLDVIPGEQVTVTLKITVPEGQSPLLLRITPGFFSVNVSSFIVTAGSSLTLPSPIFDSTSYNFGVIVNNPDNVLTAGDNLTLSFRMTIPKTTTAKTAPVTVELTKSTTMATLWYESIVFDVVVASMSLTTTVTTGVQAGSNVTINSVLAHSASSSHGAYNLVYNYTIPTQFTYIPNSISIPSGTVEFSGTQIIVRIPALALGATLTPIRFVMLVGNSVTPGLSITSKTTLTYADGPTADFNTRSVTSSPATLVSAHAYTFSMVPTVSLIKTNVVIGDIVTYNCSVTFIKGVSNTTATLKFPTSPETFSFMDEDPSFLASGRIPTTWRFSDSNSDGWNDTLVLSWSVTNIGNPLVISDSDRAITYVKAVVRNQASVVQGTSISPSIVFSSEAGNTTLTIPTPVDLPVISVSTAASPANADAGDTVTLTYTIRSTRNSVTAYNISLSLAMPAYANITGTPTSTLGTISWNSTFINITLPSPLNSGSQFVLSLRITISNGVPTGTRLSLPARVSYSSSPLSTRVKNFVTEGRSLSATGTANVNVPAFIVVTQTEISSSVNSSTSPFVVIGEIITLRSTIQFSESTGSLSIVIGPSLGAANILTATIISVGNSLPLTLIPGNSLPIVSNKVTLPVTISIPGTNTASRNTLVIEFTILVAKNSTITPRAPVACNTTLFLGATSQVTRNTTWYVLIPTMNVISSTSSSLVQAGDIKTYTVTVQPVTTTCYNILVLNSYPAQEVYNDGSFVLLNSPFSGATVTPGETFFISVPWMSTTEILKFSFTTTITSIVRSGSTFSTQVAASFYSCENSTTCQQNTTITSTSVGIANPTISAYVNISGNPQNFSTNRGDSFTLIYNVQLIRGITDLAFSLFMNPNPASIRVVQATIVSVPNLVTGLVQGAIYSPTSSRGIVTDNITISGALTNQAYLTIGTSEIQILVIAVSVTADPIPQNTGGKSSNFTGNLIGANSSATLVGYFLSTPPTISAPKNVTATQTILLNFTETPISIADVDVTPTQGSFSVTLSTTTGLISINGLPVKNSATLSGSISSVNAQLLTLRYLADRYFKGTDVLSISVNDNGNLGGPSRVTTGSVNVIILPVNLQPAIVAPNSVTILEGGTTGFTGSQSITISDPDVIDQIGVFYFETQLSVSIGSLSITKNGNKITGGSVSINDTISNTNAILQTLLYTPPTPKFFGNGINSVAPIVTVTLSDQGNIDYLARPLTVSHSVSILVNPVNDPPSLDTSRAIVYMDKTKIYVSEISVSDVPDLDYARDPTIPQYTTTLTVADGRTIIVTLPGGSKKSGTGLVTFSANLAQTNQILGTIQITPLLNYTGTDFSLKILFSDNGSVSVSGTPVLTASGTVSLVMVPIYGKRCSRVTSFSQTIDSISGCLSGFPNVVSLSPEKFLNITDETSCYAQVCAKCGICAGIDWNLSEKICSACTAEDTKRIIPDPDFIFMDKKSCNSDADCEDFCDLKTHKCAWACEEAPWSLTCPMHDFRSDEDLIIPNSPIFSMIFNSGSRAFDFEVNTFFTRNQTSYVLGLDAFVDSRSIAMNAFEVPCSNRDPKYFTWGDNRVWWCSPTDAYGVGSPNYLAWGPPFAWNERPVDCNHVLFFRSFTISQLSETCSGLGSVMKHEEDGLFRYSGFFYVTLTQADSDWSLKSLIPLAKWRFPWEISFTNKFDVVSSFVAQQESTRAKQGVSVFQKNRLHIFVDTRVTGEYGPNAYVVLISGMNSTSPIVFFPGGGLRNGPQGTRVHQPKKRALDDNFPCIFPGCQQVWDFISDPIPFSENFAGVYTVSFAVMGSVQSPNTPIDPFVLTVTIDETYVPETTTSIDNINLGSKLTIAPDPEFSEPAPINGFFANSTVYVAHSINLNLEDKNTLKLDLQSVRLCAVTDGTFGCGSASEIFELIDDGLVNGISELAPFNVSISPAGTVLPDRYTSVTGFSFLVKPVATWTTRTFYLEVSSYASLTSLSAKRDIQTTRVQQILRLSIFSEPEKKPEIKPEEEILDTSGILMYVSGSVIAVFAVATILFAVFKMSSVSRGASRAPRLLVSPDSGEENSAD